MLTPPSRAAAAGRTKRDGAERPARVEPPSPPPPARIKWTRRVPHPVLIGHAASLTPGAAAAATRGAQRASPRGRPTAGGGAGRSSGGSFPLDLSS